jgi:uncharacterized protein DUF6920
MRSGSHAEAAGQPYGGLMLDQMTPNTASSDPLITELPEPVRRYLQHALPAGPHPNTGVRLQMTGRIKVGLWLPFTAVQDCDGRSFEWRARIGPGSLEALEVVDRYASGVGSVTGRLLGRYQVFQQATPDVHRSAAARAAIEAVFTPASLLPGRGVSWRAEDAGHIVASSYLEPEQIDVHMRIDPRGALCGVSVRRWGNTGRRSHDYLTFGGDVHADQRFGNLVIPSDLTVGWRYGGAGYKPFFQAHINALQTDCHTGSSSPCPQQLN